MLWVRRRLREEILDLAQKGVDTFLTGGALGFDTLAAQEVLRMRAMGLPSLKLVLALPYMNQEAQWSQRDAAVYRTLLRQADNVVYTSQEYHRGCLFQRNRYLVDHSAYCVCYLLQERTGTSYTALLFTGRQGAGHGKYGEAGNRRSEQKMLPGTFRRPAAEGADCPGSLRYEKAFDSG